MKKRLLIITLLSIVFIGSVLYNLSIAQSRLKESRPAGLSIQNVVVPSTVKVGEAANFSWKIDATSDQTTNFTTIYWGYVSSPSSLLQTFSPGKSVYPFHLPDYTAGTFHLPDVFDLNISFGQSGKVYFRSYAKVGNNNLWSPEQVVSIIP